ncbi:MAG TPA: hypothetical protein VHF45_07995 [Thermoleophilaceae bacterium]|nr:hypothetical protein [Thermoleophilaceae bacterium]
MARGGRHAWLSITPEPERELPHALTTLRAGGPPEAAAVGAEQARVHRLITRGGRRGWLIYLREARELAERAPGNGAVGEARAVVLDVIDNHDQLTLGLPRGRLGGSR